MKSLFLLPAILCVLATGLHAGMKLPSWVFEANELGEAMAQAEDKGKGLAFVLTDLDTT